MHRPLKKILMVISAIVGISVIWALLFASIKASRGKDIEVKDSKENYKIERENYDISMKFKAYEDYVIGEYIVKTKDGSEIKSDDIRISTLGDYKGLEYSLGPVKISSDINGNEMKIIEAYYIAATADKNTTRDLKIVINIKTPNGYEESDEFITVPLDKSNSSSNLVKKTINMDGIDINIISMRNFEFGSLLNLYTTNLNDEQRRSLEENYLIKLKSNDFEKNYEIMQMVEYDGKETKYLNKLINVNSNSKLTEFFIGRMIYDSENIDRDNMQVYLVNKQTNEEKLIF